MQSHDEFPAVAFAPDLPNGQLKGRVRRLAHAVVFEAETVRFALPIEGLAARMGGFDDRMLFLSHPSQPGVELASVEPGWAVATADLPAVAHVTRRRRGGRSRFWGCLLFSGLALLVLLVAGFFGWQYLVAMVVEHIPPELERKVGEVAASAYGLADEQESPALATLAAPLTAVSQGSGWRFFLVPDATVNAFALPGGVVAVHCGLVAELDGPSPLVGVLAHEIAHVEERHGLRSVVSAVALQATVSLLIGDVSGFEGLLVGLGTDIAGLSYSRELEEAADDRGYELLVDAGLGPTGLVLALETLATLDSGSAAMPAFLSSHPHPGERATRIAARGGVGSSVTGGAGDTETTAAFAAVQETCAEPAG